jgi:hypothetical protein
MNFDFLDDRYENLAILLKWKMVYIYYKSEHLTIRSISVHNPQHFGIHQFQDNDLEYTSNKYYHQKDQLVDIFEKLEWENKLVHKTLQSIESKWFQ